MRNKFITCLALAIAAFDTTVARADDEVKVPFVRCPSDGQMGPQPGSKGEAQTIHISFKLPGPIAYYDGVYAPAGWHCFELIGSSGNTVIVSAKPIPKWVPGKEFWIDAPAIQMSSMSGETSGRFGVATYGHMLFPDLTKDFVKAVEDEGIESKDDIELAKYPTDTFTSLNKTLVHFETPANTKGIGTAGDVAASKAPIIGLVSLGLEGSEVTGISILRISMGTKDDTWSKVLMMLNTPCVTGIGCPHSDSGDSE